MQICTMATNHMGDSDHQFSFDQNDAAVSCNEKNCRMATLESPSGKYGRACFSRAPPRTGSIRLMPVSRDRQIRRSHIVCVDRPARNFSFVVYVLGCFEPGRETGLFQVVEILHGAV